MSTSGIVNDHAAAAAPNLRLRPASSNILSAARTVSDAIDKQFPGNGGGATIGQENVHSMPQVKKPSSSSSSVAAAAGAGGSPQRRASFGDSPSRNNNLRSSPMRRRTSSPMRECLIGQSLQQQQQQQMPAAAGRSPWRNSRSGGNATGPTAAAADSPRRRCSSPQQQQQARHGTPTRRHSLLPPQQQHPGYSIAGSEGSVEGDAQSQTASAAATRSASAASNHTIATTSTAAIHPARLVTRIEIPQSSTSARAVYLRKVLRAHILTAVNAQLATAHAAEQQQQQQEQQAANKTQKEDEEAHRSTSAASSVSFSSASAAQPSLPKEVYGEQIRFDQAPIISAVDIAIDNAALHSMCGGNSAVLGQLVANHFIRSSSMSTSSSSHNDNDDIDEEQLKKENGTSDVFAELDGVSSKLALELSPEELQQFVAYTVSRSSPREEDEQPQRVGKLGDAEPTPQEHQEHELGTNQSKAWIRWVPSSQQQQQQQQQDDDDDLTSDAKTEKKTQQQQQEEMPLLRNILDDAVVSYYLSAATQQEQQKPPHLSLEEHIAKRIYPSVFRKVRQLESTQDDLHHEALDSEQKRQEDLRALRRLHEAEKQQLAEEHDELRTTLIQTQKLLGAARRQTEEAEQREKESGERLAAVRAEAAATKRQDHAESCDALSALRARLDVAESELRQRTLQLAAALRDACS